MKNCSSCGAPMPDNAGFCGKCGNMITQTEAAVKVTTGNQNSRSGMKFKIIMGAVLAVVLLTGGFLGWNYFTSQASIETKLDLAVKYLSDNNYDKAILTYNEAIKIEPQEVKAYQGLAKVYTLQGKYDDARDTYDKGLAAVTTEDQIVLRLGLGGMYIDQGQIDSAATTFQEIKDNNAGCLEAYWGLAMVYKQKGDVVGAEALLKQAVEKNPNEYRAYNALALYQQQNGQADEAFDNLVKSLSLEINQQEAYLVLSDLYKDNWNTLTTKASGISNRQVSAMLEFYSYYAAGDYQNAIHTYEAKLKDQTTNDKAQILAGIAMYKTGNTSRAEDLIKQISNKDINKWLLSDVAEYYFIAGDKEKAKATAIKALEANSTNLDAVALLQRINTNDEDSKIYTAEYLLYNWNPVAEARETLEQSGVKVFIKTAFDDSDTKAETEKTEENSDPKVALLQDAAAYFQQKNKDLHIVLEPPYGAPKAGDYVVFVKDIDGDTATVLIGLWQSEGSFAIFQRAASGRWEFLRAVEEDSSETESGSVTVPAKTLAEKEQISRQMLYDYDPKIKQELDAGTRHVAGNIETMYVDSEWYKEGYFLFHVYYIVDYENPQYTGHTATMGWYRVYPDTGEIWDDLFNKRLR